MEGKEDLPTVPKKHRRPDTLEGYKMVEKIQGEISQSDWNKLTPDSITVTRRTCEASFTYEDIYEGDQQSKFSKHLWVKYGESIEIMPSVPINILFSGNEAGNELSSYGKEVTQETIDKYFSDFVAHVREETLRQGRIMWRKLRAKKGIIDREGKT